LAFLGVFATSFFLVIPTAVQLFDNCCPRERPEGTVPEAIDSCVTESFLNGIGPCAAGREQGKPLLEFSDGQLPQAKVGVAFSP